MRWASVAVGTVGVGLGAAIKGVYRTAGADALLWILAPSSWLARFLGGVDLRYEEGAGFISHADRLVVGAPCAGLNFLVVAFLTLLLAHLSRFESARAKVGWLLASLALAYAATVVTNGVRIAVSAHLYGADIYRGAVTPERVHRLAGTVIYYGSLLAVYLAVGVALRAHGRRLLPLGCYLLVSVGVPLAGRAWAGDPARFVEHLAWVVGTALVLTAVALLPAFLRDRLQWRT